MFAVMLVRERQSTVAASADLRLVRVDEDPRVARGTTAAIAGNDAIVRPAHRLLVNELHGGVRLWLHAVVCLLEPRPGHGLGSGLLAARPDALTIGSLLGGRGQGLLAGNLGRCSFLCGRGHGGAQV
jgi:hypothetical protein